MFNFRNTLKIAYPLKLQSSNLLNLGCDRTYNVTLVILGLLVDVTGTVQGDGIQAPPPPNYNE